MLHHHAQLIEGNIDSYNQILADLEQKLGLHKSHPDLSAFSFVHEKLGIDDAHKIHHVILRQPSMSPQTVTVIHAETLTETAQNALLKIFEEPPQNSYIFLITNFLPHLLPTLRSRFVIYRGMKGEDGKSFIKANDSSKMPIPPVLPILSVQNFISSGIEKRLAIVKDIHTGLDKETISIGDVWNFTNELESMVRQNAKGDINKLDALVRTQQYMHAPGNSVKMLLEYLAVRV